MSNEHGIYIEGDKTDFGFGKWKCHGRLRVSIAVLSG